MRFLIVATLLLVPLAFAHLDAGQDVRVGPYLVDFGHAPADIVAGEPAFLNLILVNGSEMVAHDATWMRISHDGTFLFAGSLDSRDGPASFTYAFPEPGAYEIAARFTDGGETLAETTLSLEIHEAPRYMLAGILIGFILLVLIMKRRKGGITRPR